MSKQNQQSKIVASLNRNLAIYDHLKEKIGQEYETYFTSLDDLENKNLDEVTTDDKLDFLVGLKISETKYAAVKNDIALVAFKISNCYNLLKGAGFKFDPKSFNEPLLQNLSQLVSNNYALTYKVSGQVVTTDYKLEFDTEKIRSTFPSIMNPETEVLEPDTKQLHDILASRVNDHIQGKEMARVQKEQMERNQKMQEMVVDENLPTD